MSDTQYRERLSPAVDAYQWDGDIRYSSAPHWLVDAFNEQRVDTLVDPTCGPQLRIRNCGRVQVLSPGDWIVCDADGLLHGYNNAAFRSMYEPIVQTPKPIMQWRTWDGDTSVPPVKPYQEVMVRLRCGRVGRDIACNLRWLWDLPAATGTSPRRYAEDIVEWRFLSGTEELAPHLL